MKETEKRGATRVTYVSELECESGTTRLVARTADISATGIFIRSILCCEPGSVLRLRFSVGTTKIETLGEVCNSIPQIGMGVRFLDLDPNQRAAIEELVESRSAQSAAHEVAKPRLGVELSGVEPIDRSLGGLSSGHLYFVHGDASGKSLLGTQFLIQGLSQRQIGALITSHSPEQIVARFARLGYDCLEDISEGRLALYKYARDPGELEPLLHELESVLDDADPERIVFDSVTDLLAGGAEDVASQTVQFAVWARSFGATAVLIANEESTEVIENLLPCVKESFRFGVEENQDRLVRFIAFEKSPLVPHQVVRIDPSRGISSVENQPTEDEPRRTAEMVTAILAGSRTPRNVEDRAPVESVTPTTDWRKAHLEAKSSPTMTGEAPDATEESHDAFSAMLEELEDLVSSVDPELVERGQHRRTQGT